MFSVLTSVSRAWRLLMSATLISAATTTSAQAQFGGDPPRLAELRLQSGTSLIGFAPVTLEPAFDSEQFEYNISIPFEHSEVQVVSAQPVDSLHFVTEPSIPPLPPGQTTPFTITVDEGFFGPASTTYTIHVTRGVSNDVAALCDLVVSGTTLSPSFNQLTFEYTASVPNGTTSVTLTPTTLSETSTITVNGATATSGSPFGPIDLVEGANEAVIRVTDQGDMATDVTKAYVVNIVRRPPSSDTDGDGMDDGFEAINGLTVGIDDAALDLDGDGLSNLGEYAFGSDPNDFTDHKKPVVEINPDGLLQVTFIPAIPANDGSYQVQVSSNLTDWTNDVTEDGASTPETQVWRDNVGGPTRFIRVAFTSSL